MKADVEKIKAEYEQKIQEAIEVNKVLDILGDENFRIYISKNYSNKDKKSLNVRAEDVCANLTIEQVGLVLSKLPVTEKINVHVGQSKYLQMDYKLQTRRSYRDSFATLDIEYVFNDYVVDIKLPIEPNKQLSGFFADSHRNVEQSEITTYYIVSRPGRKAADVKVPVKVFANGEYVRFQGGYVTSMTEWACENIVEEIKGAYLNLNSENN